MYNGFDKGSIPWNKGRGGYSTLLKGQKRPADFGKKVSATRKQRFADGSIITWNKGKKCPYSSGKNHYNWKGGSTHGERVKFRDQMQMVVFKRDNFTCQICEQYGGSLQVDHVKSWAKYPELRFDIDNCRTLCMACHYYLTFKKKLPMGVIWGHNLSRRIES